MALLKKHFWGLALFAILAAPLAHAQHGSINGPVTTGPLNPATGATEVSIEKLFTAESKCGLQMLKDMVSFYIVPTGPGQVEEETRIDSVSSAYQVASLTFYPTQFSYTGALGPVFAQQYYTQVSFHAGTETDQNQSITPRFEIYYVRHVPGAEQYPGTDTFLTNSYPMVSYISGTRPVYDPATHLRLRNEGTASQLKKGVFGNIAPTDWVHVPVYNSDNTPTNFQINAQKYFQCVESEL